MKDDINIPISAGGGGIFLLDDQDNSFLDSIDTIKNEINKTKCKILLSSHKYMNQLLEKLKNYDIYECHDGIEMVASMINRYYKEKYKGKKLIAIALNGYEVYQKHLGDIPYMLKEAGFSIVYIVSLASRWANDLIFKLETANEDYVLADYEFLEALDFSLL